MAIIFQKKEGRDKKIVLFFIVLILVVGFFSWWIFFRKEIKAPDEETITIEEKGLEVKLKELIPRLEKLEPFPQVQVEEAGRENPFVPF